MLVIAFDGVLFDTLDARAEALSNALSADGVQLSSDAVRDTVEGRTFPEAVRALLPTDSLDETALDLASLRAERAFNALAAGGLALNTRARDVLLRAATVTRIVLRADSNRREVDALLNLAGLDVAVSMTRCSDDPLHIATQPASARAANSLERSYDSIKRRMAQNMSLLGENTSLGIALEPGPLGRRVAAEAGFEIATSLSALNFPAR
jgi:beta-phosphoglucomutase-like phosphatase (HAD superfamily)